MQSVWSNSEQAGTALLLMLAIADNCNDQGEAWPSVPTLARKIRASERYVRILLRELEKTGELKIIPGKRYGIDSNTLVISILLNYSSPPPLNPSSPLPLNPSSATPELQWREPLNPSSANPLRKPSVNHQEPADAAEKPAPIPNLSLGQKMFLGHFGAVRFKNNIQRDTVLELETKYGLDKLTECATWAAKRGMSLGAAVAAVEKAILKWGEKPAASPAVDFSARDPDLEYLKLNPRGSLRPQALERLRHKGISVSKELLQPGELS